MQTDAMIDIRNLSVTFNRGRKPVKAVNGVSLSVQPGEVVALLGESGSGKSVTMRSLLRLHPKGTTIEGSMTVAGRDVTGLTAKDLGAFRGAVASMVFQEPRLALDPVYTLGRQIEETIMRHEGISRSQASARALALFQKVKIPSPERRLQNYPHEMSGGMLQRSMIAMALACNPKVLLADEPTTALDATVQIQILLLIRDLQKEYGLSVIFVTHDIGVAAEVADRIAVMYAGRIVEEGRVADIIREPKHPYTKGLLGARVELAHGRDRLVTIPGAPPDLAAMPP
ncbi:ABC transporter ATP-binding protein, partial [Neorhizobium sp. BETTINA12A]|uniref:ABC transporter ATP-binding protein n=1 Tax=Neorhizobium sp. BETTINA12A TaxID=2908924 RepID=UPI0038D4175A